MAELTGESPVKHEGILETNRLFEEAFNAGDFVRATKDVYTKEARVLPPDAPMVEGRENITKFWQETSQKMGLQRIELATVELEVQGDHAYEIGRATLTLEGNDQLIFAKYVVVWKQESDRWRWHIDIWNNET